MLIFHLVSWQWIKFIYSTYIKIFSITAITFNQSQIYRNRQPNYIINSLNANFSKYRNQNELMSTGLIASTPFDYKMDSPYTCVARAPCLHSSSQWQVVATLTHHNLGTQVPNVLKQNRTDQPNHLILIYTRLFIREFAFWVGHNNFTFNVFIRCLIRPCLVSCFHNQLNF